MSLEEVKVGWGVRRAAWWGKAVAQREGPVESHPSDGEDNRRAVDKLPWRPWWALLCDGPLVSCVALGRSVHLPGPRWPHLSGRPGG